MRHACHCHYRTAIPAAIWFATNLAGRADFRPIQTVNEHTPIAAGLSPQPIGGLFPDPYITPLTFTCPKRGWNFNCKPRSGNLIWRMTSIPAKLHSAASLLSPNRLVPIYHPMLHISLLTCHSHYLDAITHPPYPPAPPAHWRGLPIVVWHQGPAHDGHVQQHTILPACGADGVAHPQGCVCLFSLDTAADDDEIRLSPICWASR